jgi:hypothetical protein
VTPPAGRRLPRNLSVAGFVIPGNATLDRSPTESAMKSKKMLNAGLWSPLKWSCALLLGAFVAACGGGSGSDPAASGGTGTVAVMLTDAPTSDFDQANVTVTGIELIGRDGARAQIFSGERTIDLLSLQDEAELFSVADVPAGVYSRIRLTVSNVELVKLDPATGEVAETVTPRLPGGNRIDLNPRSPFIVNGGDSLVIQLDVDARKSIQVTEAGGGGLTILRPVVFIDIVDGAVSARIARLGGTVSAIDAQARSFRLCGTPVAFHGARRFSDDERCLTVRADDGSAFFTAEGAAGGFADVTDGGPATVVGHIRRTADGIELAARVVYLGDADNLVRLRGTTSSAVDAGQFGLEVTRGGGFEAGDVITVGLPAGAAVFARSGLDLTPADIKADLAARIFGLEGGAQDVTALAVVLADPAALTETSISGAVGAVSATSFTLLPSAEGNVSADTTVCTGARTRIYQISGAASTAIAPSGLTSGWAANVYGHQPLGGCFAADTVIVFQPDA